MAVGSDDSEPPSVRSVSDAVTITTEPPTTTAAQASATTEPPRTIPPTTAAAQAGDDRLSAASRLGYTGLGPIKLGMPFAEVESAGQVTMRRTLTSCPVSSLVPGPNSGLQQIPFTALYGVWIAPSYPLSEPFTVDAIDVTDPAIFTLSGVHVGSSYDDVLRTYPSAVEAPIDIGNKIGPYSVVLRITNPEGRTITFYFDPERNLKLMSLGLTPTTYGRC